MSEENQERFEELNEKYEELAEAATFEDATMRVERLGERVGELEAKIEDIRERGYVFRAFLEDKAAKFQTQYDAVETSVGETIAEAVDALRDEIQRPQTLLKNLERQTENESLFGKLVEQTEKAVEELETEINTWGDKIEAIYGTLDKDVDATYRQLREIDWVMEQAEGTSFDFGDDEHVFLAAEAELVLTGKGGKDPDGVLFLTDKRLVFEQRETTGKRLGMFGGKKEHEIEWETPLSTVQGITIENKGFFKGKDMLYFETDAGEVTVEVQGRADNKFWQKQVNRMIQGDADDERAIEADEATQEKVRAADTTAECHICGATLPLAETGAESVTCQYCGATVSLG